MRTKTDPSPRCETVIWALLLNVGASQASIERSKRKVACRFPIALFFLFMIRAAPLINLMVWFSSVIRFALRDGKRSYYLSVVHRETQTWRKGIKNRSLNKGGI